jgi:hypothetical protein
LKESPDKRPDAPRLETWGLLTLAGIASDLGNFSTRGPTWATWRANSRFDEPFMPESAGSRTAFGMSD